MAIIIEGLSVVLRCEAITRHYKGGLSAFVAALPNLSLCADAELAALSFSTAQQVDSYLLYLKRQGLIAQQDNSADVVVVDQIYGPSQPCAWLEFRRIYWNQNPQQPISVCVAINSQFEGVATPSDWEYATSLSKKVRYLDGVALPEQVKFLRTENNLDVLQEIASGDLLYVPLSMRV